MRNTIGKYFVSSSIPVESFSPENMTHKFIILSNDYRAWTWCLDCDCHGRDCPQLSPSHIREKYLSTII
jgi:hypothetical protein